MLRINQNHLELKTDKLLENNFVDYKDNNLKITYFSKDDEILKKSDFIIKSKNILALNYFNDNNEKCVRFSEIFNIFENKENVTELRISKISKKELLLKNIITKDDDEIKKHIFNLISNMNCSDSYKNIIKQQFNNTTKFLSINNRLPILYFDDKLNKKVWVVPNNINLKEDLIFDYETEIPFFQESYNNYFTSINDGSFVIKSFMVFTKDETISYNLTDDSTITYNIQNPKGFVFSDVCNTEDKLIFKKEEIYFREYTTRKINLLMPQLYNLNEKLTLKILNLMESEKNIEEIKRNIETFLTPNYHKQLKIMEEYVKGIKSKGVDFEINNTFISNKIDFFDNDQNNSGIKYILNKETYLSNLKIYCNLFNESIEIKLNVNDVNIDKNYLYNLDVKVSKNIILLENKEKILLPKEPKNKGIIYDDIENKIYNYFDNKKYFFYDENFICIKNDDNGNSLIELDKNFIFDERNNDKISVIGKNDFLLLHHQNKDLYLIDVLSQKFLIIDNTEYLTKLDSNVVTNLRLSLPFNTDISLVLTDNKSFYFSDKINKDFKYMVDLKEFNNYIFNLKLPLLKQRENYYKFKKTNYLGKNQNKIFEYENEYEDFDIKYKISEEFYNNKKNKTPDISLLEKELNPELFYLEKYLNGIEINNINLNKKESIFFIQQVFLKSDMSFNIKNEEENHSIEINNLNDINKPNRLIIKNKYSNYNLSILLNQKIKKSKILNLYKKNKLIFNRNNELLGKIIYSTNSKLFLLNDTFSDVFEQNFSLNKTKLLEKNVLNNDRVMNFNENNNEFEFIFDKNGILLKINNKDLINNINKKIESFDISF